MNVLKNNKPGGEVLPATGLLTAPTGAILQTSDPYHLQTNSEVIVSQSFKAMVTKRREAQVRQLALGLGAADKGYVTIRSHKHETGING
jgi:hypothetical protein